MIVDDFIDYFQAKKQSNYSFFEVIIFLSRLKIF